MSFLTISQITRLLVPRFDPDLSLPLFTSSEVLKLSFYLRLPGQAATAQRIQASPPTLGYLKARAPLDKSAGLWGIVQLLQRWKRVSPEPVTAARHVMCLGKPECCHKAGGLFEGQGVRSSQSPLTSLPVSPAY